ncbi:MAG TPA: hypothetical protein VJ917_08940, partial [Saprospiraceae bacterium]|nr:hypothetical protein [Saprospiraceae bacterium]
DLPGSKDHEQVTHLGKGAAIKILDGRTICDGRMVRFLRKTADKNNIPWQHEVLPMGGTDTAALQREGNGGSIAGAISIPTRHIHQVIEMCHSADIEAAINLLKASVLELDQANWEIHL